MHHLLNKVIFALLVLSFCKVSSQSIFDTSANTLLWKISGNNIKTPSYLYGTMHTTHPKAFQLGDSVLHALVYCQNIAIEVLLNANDMPNYLDVMFMKEVTLQDLTKRKDYIVIKKYLNKNLSLFTSIFNIDKVKPIYLYALLGNINNESSSQLVLDDFIRKIGECQNKTILGIESIEEQISILDKLPLTEQANLLLNLIKNEEKEIQSNKNTENEVLLNIYAQQNLDTLLLIYNQEKKEKELKNFNTAILENRNIVMANRISKMCAKTSHFIAIGALHLPGKKGVINLLKEQGFTVSPIFSSQKINASELTPKQIINILDYGNQK